MTRQDLILPGQRFRVTHSPSGSSLYDANSGQRVWDTDIVEAFSWTITPDLWPEGELRVGQSWSYSEGDMVHRLSMLSALGGRINLRVERIEPEPSSGLMTAYIRGNIRTKIDFDIAPLDFDAKVSIDLPLAIGVPFMLKFEGNLSGRGTMQDDWGRTVPFTITAEGTALMVSKPSDAVLSAVGAKPGGARGAYGSDSSRFRTQGYSSQDQGYDPTYSQQYGGQQWRDNVTHTGSHSNPRLGRTGGPNYIVLTQVREPNEGAFTIRIPRGWQTAGGIYHINPSEAGGPGNSIASKCDFVIKKDAAGSVYLHYLPEINYSSGDMYGLFRPGSTYQGMTVVPLMSAISFLEQTFTKQHPNATNV